MILSLPTAALAQYTSDQLNHFFPDGDKVDLVKDIRYVSEALNKIEFCFKHTTLPHYFNGEKVIFNHLYSDHYVVYLWFLSNVVYKDRGRSPLANKIYYLNKAIHAFDCMYDTQLPDIFLLFHCSGTMLGKATYSDFFVVLQGCTVGAHRGKYPVFSKGVSISANSSVIGDCTIGKRCAISTSTTLFQKNLEDDHIAFMNFDKGTVEIKRTQNPNVQRFFNVDLYSI